MTKSMPVPQLLVGLPHHHSLASCLLHTSEALLAVPCCRWATRAMHAWLLMVQPVSLRIATAAAAIPTPQ